MEECHLLLTDQVDLVNPEGHQVVPDVSKPLPLGGPPGQVTIQTQHFFNKDLEYLVSVLLMESPTGGLSAKNSKSQVTVPPLIAIQLDPTCGFSVYKPRAVIYRDRNDQKKMMRETEVHKFSDGTLNRILDKLDHMVKDFKLFKYNPGMETRIWSEEDRRRSKEFMEVIDRRLKIRRIFRSLESIVGGSLRDVDYRLIQRTE
ncbi:hypothetical protein Tco_0537580 [Tanacetum coccineum]